MALLKQTNKTLLRLDLAELISTGSQEKNSH